MKLVFAVVVLCSSFAFADEPDAGPPAAAAAEIGVPVAAPPVVDAGTADAPLAQAVPDLPGVSVRLKAGQPAPFPGWLQSDEEAVRREKINEQKAGTLGHAQQDDLVSRPVAIALLAVAVVIGAAIGTGTTLAVEKAKSPK